MGIDIYARWKGQTKEEEKAQYTGFDTWAGHVGYLREAYHGDPYATKVLLPEAFDNNGEPTKIPAALLRARLPRVLEVARERGVKLYKQEGEELEKSVKSFSDFVELCEKKEKETGKPCEIIASF